MVLRRQAFAGHTLSVMAFPGATGAALAGIPTALGYYIACGVAALAMRGTGRARASSRSAETAAIGTIQATGLALGYLFLSLNQQVLGGPETLLFGTFLGISSGQVLTLLAIAAGALVALAFAARPLLLATLDREVARASGLPVAALDLAFPADPRGGGRDHQPDHGRAARVRAAGRAAGGGPEADRPAASESRR